MKVSENCCLNIRVRISDKRTLIFVLMKYGKSAENEVDGTGIQLSVSSQFWNPQFSDSIIQLRNRRGKLTTGYTWFLVSLCKCVNNYDEITRFYNKNQPLKFTRLSAKKNYLLTLFLFLLALLWSTLLEFFRITRSFFLKLCFFFAHLKHGNRQNSEETDRKDKCLHTTTNNNLRWTNLLLLNS